MRPFWIKIIALALVVYAACAYYTLHLNAESRFWSEALFQKRAWTERMNQTGEAKTIFAGGSTTLFAFPSERLYEEHNISSVNMGLTVGMGVPFLCALAFEAAEPGDTLVLLLEPGFLCGEPSEPTTLSVQTALRSDILQAAFGRPLWDHSIDWGLVIGSMRPGLYHVVTAVLKKTFNRPAYRYPTEHLDAAGYLWMDGQDPDITPFGRMNPMTLSPYGIELLQHLAAYSHEHDIRLYYALPWFLSQPEYLDNNRQVHQQLLEEIEQHVAVVDDGFYGFVDDQQLFYDQVHLSPTGAYKRSTMLMEALK